MAGETLEDVLLLVDTCGEQASVVLMREGERVREVLLPERAASTGLLGAVEEVLAAEALSLRHLAAVGVVRGPGSFTGVRVGLAVCKGLCEAAAVRLAAVSRLEVLAEAAGLREGFAVLRAGRGQMYARELRDGLVCDERLVEVAAVRGMGAGQDWVCAEQVLESALLAEGARVRCVPLSAADALGPVRRCLAAGGSDLATVDANYVRDEAAIYAQGRRHG